MNEPAWLAEARKHIGTKEIPGVRHESKILGWWKAIKRGGVKTDEVPWCAAFVGGCLEAVGIVSTRFESARSYLTWGVALPRPVVGCIVVIGRPGHSGAGHVFFAAGIDTRGWIIGLGGNQGDAVTVASFDPKRVLGYRWPLAVPIADEPLRLISAKVKESTSEA